MRQLRHDAPPEAGRLLRVLLLRLHTVPADAGRGRRLLRAGRAGPVSRTVRWADSAGVLGAVFAALCCAGAPVILSVLAAVGLSALRRDAILVPLMVGSLAVALWGFAADRRAHARAGPLGVATAGAVALVAGVVFVHGPPAYLLIDGGALALVAATLWNVRARIARRLLAPTPATCAVAPRPGLTS